MTTVILEGKKKWAVVRSTPEITGRYAMNSDRLIKRCITLQRVVKLSALKKRLNCRQGSHISFWSVWTENKVRILGDFDKKRKSCIRNPFLDAAAKGLRTSTLLLYMKMLGSKVQKAVHACMIRLLNLGSAKHEKVAIYVVNQRISNVCRIAGAASQRSNS